MFDDKLGTLIQALKPDAVAESEHPALWGGAIEASQIEDFLQAWDWAARDMPWRIWEYEDRIALERSADLPADLVRLERGRLFGPGGDLSLRRDAGRILWHFVGPRNAPAPAKLQWAHLQYPATPPPYAAVDFWKSNPQASRPWQRRSQSVLLWGQEERDQDGKGVGVWREDRVSGVRSELCYPTLSGSSSEGRAQLVYWEYLWGDAVQAVWWQGITPWERSNKEGKA